MAQTTFTDRIFEKTILKVFPKKITPNQITVFRFYTIPFIIYFFLEKYNLAGTILFILAAFSDALDGAIARTQNRITNWGKIYDPLADKLLIGSVAIILITKYLNLYLTLAIVLMEIIIVAVNIEKFMGSLKGRVGQAQWAGKIKMILQCVGIIFLLFFILFHAPIWRLLSEGTLWIAIAFAFVSIFVYSSI